MAGTDSERPRQPGRAIRVRDKARKGLARHFYLMVLGGALLARRRPGRVTAVAILLGILSAVLAIYSAQRVAGLPSPAADAAAAVGVGLLVGVWCRDAWAAAAAKKSETVGVVR